MNDGQVVIDLKLNSKSFDAQIEKTKKDLDALIEKEKMLSELNKNMEAGKGIKVSTEEYKNMQKFGITMEDIGNSKALTNLQVNIEKTKNKLVDLNNKAIGTEKANIFEGMNKSMSGVLKKVAKWSMAVIGVRSMYLGIRKVMSTLTQYDTQLADKLNYMQFAMANALKPVIEWIVNALYEILSIIGEIIYAISGYNIFQNSGIKDYEKAMKRSAGSAKEIKKSLAGFDEMNVLADNSDSGKSGGLSGGIPDLSKTIGQESKLKKTTSDLVDKWLKLGEEMKKTIANPSLFNQAYGYWGTFIRGVVELFYGLWEVIEGIIEVVGGVMDIVVGIFTGNFDLIKDGCYALISGLGNILGGLVDIIKGVLLMIWGLIKGLLGEIWDGIKGLFSMLWDVMKKAWNGLVDGAKWAWEGIKSVFSGLANFFKDIFTKAWEGVKAVFSTGGRIFTGIKEGITNAFKRIANAIIDGLNAVVKVPFDGINWALQKIKDVDLWGWKPFDFIQTIRVPQIPRLAKGTIASVPGRGIPTPSGIFAEAGREAYLPLSDTSLLEELGSTLGKYINLNATIPVYVGNRQIAREIKKINADEDFAYNK